MTHTAASLAVRTTVALLLVFTAHATSALAQAPEEPKIVGLRVGFDSRYKLARWTPVEITFLGGSEPMTGRVRLVLPDGDGVPSVVTAPRPVQLLPGRRTPVVVYAKFGRAYGDLRVLFQVDNKDVIDREFDNHAAADNLQLPVPLDDQEKLIVTVGTSVGIEEAARNHQQATGRQVAVANLGSKESLPTQWYGYDGVDWLIISTSEPDLLSTLFDTQARRGALKEWIEQGGRLLFTAGSEAPAALAADAPLARFAPGRFAETTRLRRTTDLESYVGGSRKVRVPTGSLSLSVPRLEEVIGRVEISDGNLPLVVRSMRRFGQVVFVAVDLDRRPFVDWEGRAILLARLLGLTEPGTGAGATNQQTAVLPYSSRRVPDLFERMRRGLNEFVGVTPISFALVAAMILGYIALIGPGDYFLVKRLLKRMELTWITFPIWVVLVSVGAYCLAMYTKGDQLRLNQIDLVDVDVESGWARGTSWLNVFSPQSQTFDLAITPQEPSGQQVAESQRLLAWLGAGDARMGGGGGALFAGRYDFSPQLDELSHVPVQVWSTKSFLSRTAYETQAAPTAKLELTPDGVPAGTIRNDLKIDLNEVVLMSGSWIYLLGDLKAGDSVRLRPGEQRDLKHMLRHPEWQNPALISALPADTQQAIKALSDMLFFKAAGEGSADNSSNASAQFLDFSDLLDQNRAILVACTREPAAQLTNAGQPLSGPNDLHWTMYRFVYPVARAKPAAPNN